MANDQDNPDLPDSQDKKFDSFDIDDTGEVAGYISLDQARVLAMQTASREPGAYGAELRDVLMAFTVESEEDTEDHYVITLSFRPQGRYSGSSGQEQFFIEKEGVVAYRQVLDLPVTERGRGFPTTFLIVIIGLLVIGGGAGVVIVSGALNGNISESGEMPPVASVPPVQPVSNTPTATSIATQVVAAIATPINTPTGVPTASPSPTPTPVLVPTLAPPSPTLPPQPTSVAPTPTATVAPTPSATPTGTATPAPTASPTPTPTRTPPTGTKSLATTVPTTPLDIVTPSNSPVVLIAIPTPTLTPTPAAPVLADLVVESITWSPENPSVGDTVTFTVTIKNQGPGDALASTVNYGRDGATTRFDADSVSPIPSGQSAIETFTWKAVAGSHTFTAFADGIRQVAETLEDNNVLTITWDNALLADLVVEGITWSPQSPSVGDTVTFTVTIKNQGPGNALSSTVNYVRDGATTRFNADSVPPIPAGQSATETFTWKALAGSHTFTAFADGIRQVAETIEDNNSLTVIVN